MWVENQVVDFEQYKNMVGAFHQPRLVYMNLNTLKSLPDDQFASGMGEVLKSGLIRDARFTSGRSTICLRFRNGSIRFW